MEAYSTVYVGAEVEFDDLFTKHEECSNCRRKINNPKRQRCPGCEAKLTDPESKIQLWTPKVPELLGLADATPLDEDGWDTHVLSVDWGSELFGEIEVFRASFSPDAPLLLGLELAATEAFNEFRRHGDYKPRRLSQAQVTEAFAKVRAALEEHSLGGRPIEMWVGGFIS